MTISPEAHAALTARYGAAAPDEILWNETLAAMLDHRSVRAFTAEPLPDAVLPTLIAAAQSAATSSNLQTWSVVAVRDPQRKAELANLAGDQAQIRECPLFLVWLADLARLADVAAARELPHDALDYTEMLLVAAIDATLAAQNAAVAAASLGLGTVYIGAMRNRPLDVARVLGLPPRTFAVFGLCVGWPDPARPTAVKPRLPHSAVLHDEQYQTDQTTVVAAYNAEMAEFYASQQMQVRGDWAEHSAKRVAGPQALSGRDVLRAMLNERGFALR